MDGNYFDRARNIGYVDGQETRDHNEWRRLMGQRGYSTEETSWGSKGGFGGGGSFGGGDFSSTLRSALETSREFSQPAIKSLEESKPNIEARYKNLIDTLKGRESRDVGQIRQNTGAEFSKRGIPLSSSAYEDAVQQRSQPISESYTGQIKDVGYQQAADINAVNQAIANLMSGGISGGNILQSALGYAQLGQGQSQFEQQLELERQRLAQANRQSKSLLTLPSTGGYIIDPATGSIINQLGQIRSQFGGGSWEFF